MQSVRSGVVVVALIVVLSMAMPSILSGTSSAAPTPASPASHAALPTAAPSAPAAPASSPAASVAPATASGPHPGTLDVYEVAPGGATTEDPAVAYDTVSYEPILNVYEELVTYNGTSNTTYVPVLATCVPLTAQCSTDYHSTLVYQADGAQYTGATGEPIYWTFVLDGAAKYYDPSTGKSWGVYPTDVMFSEAREAAWASIIGVGSTAGWLTTQALLPNGTGNWDGGLHGVYNNTPGDVLSSMLINDTAYCPAAAITNEHGCITFKADGGGSDWPFFIQLIDDGFAGAIVPCGWYTYEGAGIPGWTGTRAANGDGPCSVPELGHSQSTSSAAWASYITNLTSPANKDASTNMTSWDSYETLLASTYPAPNPKVQWNMVGSGPYYGKLTPTSDPPGYTLYANPAYAQPSGCSGLGGLATYGGYCDPAPGKYIGKVQVYYEPTDSVGISEYRAGQADFATILPPETGTMLALKDEGKLNDYIAPSISDFFLPYNLNWSSSAFTSDSFSGTPNVPSDFFSSNVVRDLLSESYPYAEAEATAWTVDGIPYLYPAGGPIAKGMGDFYPTNVSFPNGTPESNPSDVGGAAWWWAQGTNVHSAWYDPQLAACLTTACIFPVVGELGNPGLDTAISEWISEIESITSDHLQPYSFDLNFGGPGSIIATQLVAPPGTGPLPVWNLGWAPDNFDPQDYMLPLAFPNSTYTYSDAVAEQFLLPRYDDTSVCGHSATTGAQGYKDLIYWAHQGQLAQDCQGVAYWVANTWNGIATHVANLVQRELDYNLVEHILNALSLYVWYGQANQVTTAAPWIDGSSINFNPAVGGGGDQYWYQIEYQKFSSPVTFQESGLPTGTPWTVTFGTSTQTSTTGSMVFNSIPNGTFPFTVAFENGYSVTPANGNITVKGPATMDLAFAALATPTYPVTFNETGLVSNTTWSVVINDTGTQASNYPNTTFQLPDGTYSFYPEVVAGYAVAPAGGHVTVDGGAAWVNLTYTTHLLPVYNVTFEESGLPGGSLWSVNLSAPTIPGFSLNSTGTTITFGENAGSFTARFTAPAGYVPVTPTLSLTVTGAYSIVIEFAPINLAFPLVFEETGLASGTLWSVTLTEWGLTLDSTTASITATLPNGSYVWTVAPIGGYSVSTHGGSAAVTGATTKAVPIAFTVYTFGVTFFEGGLPAGATWNVTINSVTTSSTNVSLSVSLPNGTYSFTVTPPTGYAVYSPAGGSGSLSVANASQELVVYFNAIPATYTVTFTETGLPAGTTWTISFAGVNQSVATSSHAFTEPSGTLSFGIGVPKGYTATPSSGVVTVVAKSVTVTIAFKAIVTPSPSPSSSYLSKLAYEVIGALVVLALIGFVLAGVMAMRRPPAAPPPKGWSESAESNAPSSPAGEEPEAKS